MGNLKRGIFVDNITSYIIGAILLAIILIIIGLVLRKRIYDQVDKLEAWKMDIMHRQVSAELQRVKALNLSGETQDKFESWKETWDQILTRELPDIEEYLFDAEESADRFRIKSANQNLTKVSQILDEIEATIKKMYVELDELLDSEKQSRLAIQDVLPELKSLRQLLLENRHLYGPAEKRFEDELDNYQERLDAFYVACDEGNYFEARKSVTQMKEDLLDLSDRMNDFPQLYKQLKRTFPDQLVELKNGISEMEKEGYRFDSQKLLKELEQFELQIDGYITELEKHDEPDLLQWMTQFEERIQEIYLTLETEAKAKQYLDKHVDSFTDQLEKEKNHFTDTDEEVKDLQKTYLLEGSDLELHENLDKWMHQLEKNHHNFLNQLGSIEEPFSDLKAQLEQNKHDLGKFVTSHEEFKGQIQSIRSDELAARSFIKQTKSETFQLEKKLERSNLPGIPSGVINQLEDVNKLIVIVDEKLAEQPLDMGQVNQKTKELTNLVDITKDKIQLILEQAYLVEYVIQYTNRYRSRYPMLQAKLLEAEQLFYNQQYEAALELATQSLEEVAPGKVKQLEARIVLPE